jgi:hypothetical protein
MNGTDAPGPLYPRLPTQRLTGDEVFAGGPRGMTVVDYWRWAYSSLNSNVERGKLAEYLVACAVGVARGSAVQEAWADWDVRMDDGTTIEVKCSAYIQDWDQNDYSRIVFGGLKARELYYSEAVKPAAEIGAAAYKADVYVFCLQHHREHASFSVRDLGQWTFYVLNVDELRVVSGDAKSVSIGTLTNAGVVGLPWNELAAAIRAAADRRA